MLKKCGPWAIKKRVQKYKNPWIEVNEDQVIRPDGKPGIFGIVEQVGGVSVLPLDNKGFVYLTEEFRYAINRRSIEVVSGANKKGESALNAAKRELKEEIGVKAKKWDNLGLVNPLTSVLKSPQRLFLARALEFTEASPEGTEIIKLIEIKLEEAVKMVMKSKITHAPTCTLILKANEYLKEK
ncbi:hypothetical protein COY23_04525 [bacterium (Candidatus Torokbacteria) CG_4_10_14_0_2_um_filter_35_8]|nr:MAG: hypothetical protein COY23_04525 [bacterium (Candidatus Torokbacteria) CG_4_10_14_0_2_um_filter_35_8]